MQQNIGVDLALNPTEFHQTYGRKKQVATYTLGCKVNQYETEAMEQLFQKNGYEVVDMESFSDVYIINTCTVTAMSDKKSRQMIRRTKKINPDSLVVVVGCYSQKSPQEVLSIEGVNLVMGTSNRDTIVAEVEHLYLADKRVKVQDIMKQRTFEDLSIDDVRSKTRAFIKIQEGCDRFCTYCIIPYTRGPVRSQPIEKITKEVEALAQKGFKEIVLTGIHVASYGKDLGEERLIHVIEAIAQVEGIERIRTSSVEPLIITEEFLSRLQKLPKFCPHFHLSLQSGSDTVLERMKRRYNTATYRQAVENIRSIYPEAAITTDVIVGFPGETKAEFQQTKEFLEEMNLYEMHIFKFSPREGTPAATMPQQVAPEIKQQRSDELLELAAKNKENFEKKYIGRTVSVLFEAEENNLSQGHTKEYLKVSVPKNHKLTGNIKEVLITEVIPEGLMGHICK